MPPHLMNYQAWLNAQGLTFQAGITPENNLVDNAADAWNDSITVSDDSSANASDFALIIMENQQVIPSVQPDLVTVTVDVHRQWIRFGLSTQGSILLELLLTEPIPRQQLNTAIILALRPMLATMGPWSQRYGLRQDCFHVDIQVSDSEDGL